jgi:cytochrome c peroxidase
MRSLGRVWVSVVVVGWLGGCSADLQRDGVELQSSAPLGEDGLAEAYGIFKAQLVADGRDRSFRIGFARNPLVVTEAVGVNGKAASGRADLRFDAGRVLARLDNVPAGESFDLWLIKNVEGDGRSVKPEDSDLMVDVGTFVAAGASQTLDVAVSAETLAFDLDMVVVARTGQSPATSVIAAGARTLFEKRFFRERAGLPMDPVTGELSDTVETTDPLVRRGAKVFFDETFAGNGRTCGTCHRQDNNLTLDAAFVATLPPDDPLFVAETNPDLAGLEDPVLLRSHALIRANADGAEDPTVKFVMRSTPHTLAMSTSIGDGTGPGQPNDDGPPDQRTGWSGDGAPGRGTLNEFAQGAIFQHFTRTLERRVGVDFRLPTQEEVDAIEAFELFSGRQHNPRAQLLTFSDASANAGLDKFLNRGFCVACHQDLFGGGNHTNFMFDTNVEALSRDLGVPVDGGMGGQGSFATGFGNGRFNVPPLVEAADTAPYFHNGVVETLEDAIKFYTGPLFARAPVFAIFGAPQLDDDGIREVGAFLRVINAAENLRQTRKRLAFVKANRSPGSTRLLQLAEKELDDALRVLSEKGLGQAAMVSLGAARASIELAISSDCEARTTAVANAITALETARQQLIPGNPSLEF